MRLRTAPNAELLSERDLAALAADNPEPRAPLAVVLDNSGSMLTDNRLGRLMEGLPILRQSLLDDALAAKRVEISVSSISPLKLHCDFVSPERFLAPQLAPGPDTPLGAAMTDALQRVRNRVRLHHANGLRAFRPAIMLISDGQSTDTISEAAAALRAADLAGEVNVFVVGVAGVDREALAPFTGRHPPKMLDGLKFAELFEWVTAVLKTVSHSRTHSAGAPTGQVPLPPTDGWALG